MATAVSRQLPSCAKAKLRHDAKHDDSSSYRGLFDRHLVQPLVAGRLEHAHRPRRGRLVLSPWLARPLQEPHANALPQSPSRSRRHRVRMCACRHELVYEWVRTAQGHSRPLGR
eukprot:scaffold1248_cov393-Prasinococcus_capsulatus_cf.AAC.9